MRRAVTPSQTVGPFPHEAWRWAVDEVPAGSGTLVIDGVLYDGDGRAVDDGWVEAWSPAATLHEAQRRLPGFRRMPTGAAGEFRIALPALAADEQPAAWITVFARGLLMHRFTAVFLDPNAPLLAQVPAPRRSTLIAERIGEHRWRWDIRLQGERETVFFDFA